MGKDKAVALVTVYRTSRSRECLLFILFGLSGKRSIERTTNRFSVASTNDLEVTGS
jgi:hypothetical protein